MDNETKPNASVYQIGPAGINTLAAIIAKDAAEAVTAVTAAFTAKLDELMNKLEAKKAADLPDDFRSGIPEPESRRIAPRRDGVGNFRAGGITPWQKSWFNRELTYHQGHGEPTDLERRYADSITRVNADGSHTRTRRGGVIESDLETAEIKQPEAVAPPHLPPLPKESDCGEKVRVPTPVTREHSFQWLIGRLLRLDLPPLGVQRVACIITSASVGDVYPDLPAGLTVAEIVRRLEKSTSFSNELCLEIADALVEPPLPESDDEPMAGETSRQIEEADDWLRDAYRLAYIVGTLANPNTVQGLPWSDVIHNAHRFAEKAINF